MAAVTDLTNRMYLRCKGVYTSVSASAGVGIVRNTAMCVCMWGGVCVVQRCQREQNGIRLPFFFINKKISDKYIYLYKIYVCILTIYI